MTHRVGTSFASLVLVFFFVAPSNARAITEATNDAISDICAKTSNPPYCSGVLKSAGTTDPKALALYTINQATTDSKNALKQAQSEVDKSTDPKSKERYKSCAENFDNATGDLEQAKEHLASGDYQGVNIAASGAMTEAETCSDDLPTPTSPLVKTIKVLQDKCSIVEVIANLLGDGQR